MLGSPVAQTFALCESIAQERSLATKSGDFADGYRCAAKDIAEAIRARSHARVPTALERDLRDMEVEAHTLARVVSVASTVVADMGPGTAAAEGIRRVLDAFFSDAELPEALRRSGPYEAASARRAVRRERRRAF